MFFLRRNHQCALRVATRFLRHSRRLLELYVIPVRLLFLFWFNLLFFGLRFLDWSCKQVALIVLGLFLLLTRGFRLRSSLGLLFFNFLIVKQLAFHDMGRFLVGVAILVLVDNLCLILLLDSLDYFSVLFLT